MGESRYEILRRHAEDAETSLGEDQADAFTEDSCWMRWIMWTGEWMTVLSLYVNWTELGVQEWRYSLFLPYDIDPPGLPGNFNGCAAAFDICHTLYCKKRGLIMAYHNELYDGVSNLASKAFTTTHVREYHEIYTGRDGRGGKDKLKGNPSKDEGDMKGYLLIKDFWTEGTYSINSICFVNTDATSYQSTHPEKCLETTETEKKHTYLDA